MKLKTTTFTRKVYSALTIDRAENLLMPYIKELEEMGLRLHADHCEHGNNFMKFVEGYREKLVEDWSHCKMTYCKRRFDMIYEMEE